MNYFFRIMGAPDTQVSATFIADLFTNIAIPVRDENTGALSSFRLYSADGLGRFYNSSGSILASGPTQRVRNLGATGTMRYNTPVSFIVDANAQYGVELITTTQTQTFDEVVEAYVDPVISIDPAYRSAYSLALSDGVSNLAPTVTTTPEPASFVLVGAGLLGVVSIVRRRRNAP